MINEMFNFTPHVLCFLFKKKKKEANKQCCILIMSHCVLQLFHVVSVLVLAIDL